MRVDEIACSRIALEYAGDDRRLASWLTRMLVEMCRTGDVPIQASSRFQVEGVVDLDPVVSPSDGPVVDDALMKVFGYARWVGTNMPSFRGDLLRMTYDDLVFDLSMFEGDVDCDAVSRSNVIMFPGWSARTQLDETCDRAAC